MKHLLVGSTDDWEAESAWRSRAACMGMDTDIFFTPLRKTEAAKTCAGCPVSAECGTWARQAEITDGFWAGRWAPAWTKTPPRSYYGCGADPRCGSRRGYQAGGRCAECIHANNEYMALGCKPGIRCGTRSGYDDGGRCADCRKAKREYIAKLTARKAPPAQYKK